jgi:hypothetical protein
MADTLFSHDVGDYPVGSADGTGAAPKTNTFTMITNVTAAVVSLSLIAGVGVWGYKLLMRDVSGIPVVRAVEGEMRVLPQDPGGVLAQHQGLAVNAVAAVGTAAKPADRLVLAPRDVDLSPEDQPVVPEVPAVIAEDTAAPVVEPEIELATASEAPDQPLDRDALQAASINEIIGQLTGVTATAEPINSSVTARVVPAKTVPVAPQATETAQMEVLPLATPGVPQSKRPQIRPANASERVVKASFSPAVSSGDVDPAAIPAGTRLAQLGAFDSPDVARAEWDRLQGQFGDYLAGKSRVIQQAQTGGRTFYRLRAMGFTDLSDARRFCSALVAEDADCIPVVSR